MMTGEAGSRMRRVVALGWDYLLIIGWLALLALSYLLGLRPLGRLAEAPLVVADLVITVALALLRRDRAALHDLVAGTRVVSRTR
ncbi:hypothetical protein ACQPYK_18955 [Streptosporangium sp. CA-135522]|uniref:hypothetical protein n=1 Tax=Streptosporangium sp. CA-135522 TaxID=3240072 RepID=UPI003D8C9A6C